MTQAKSGDTVSIHYTGKLADGTIFDSSVDQDPLTFTLGKGELIEGFEEGVNGMTIGEKRTITITPDKGYGERSEEMVITLPSSQIPADIKPEVGLQLQLTSEDGQPFVMQVVEMTEENITLDGNPPLAGHTLTFDLELVAIT